jgi:hypothetical protein
MEESRIDTRKGGNVLWCFLLTLMWCRAINFLNVYHSNVLPRRSPATSKPLQMSVRTMSNTAEFKLCRLTSGKSARQLLLHQHAWEGGDEKSLRHML